MIETDSNETIDLAIQFLQRRFSANAERYRDSFACEQNNAAAVEMAEALFTNLAVEQACSKLAEDDAAPDVAEAAREAC